MKPHLFLFNPKGEVKKFDASRSYDRQEVPQKSPEAYRPQKERLSRNLAIFLRQRNYRRQNRILDIPAHLEYIRISFYIIFNNNDVFQTKKKFEKKYGLVPVHFSDFNQTVLFLINDGEKFQSFIKILRAFCDSDDDTLPAGKEYAIITTIHGFEFLSSKKIIVDNPGNKVVLSLVESSEKNIEEYTVILNELLGFLDDRVDDVPGFFYQNTFGIIEIENINHDLIQTIAGNFDIIHRIQSFRVPTIRNNDQFAAELSWGIKLLPPRSNTIIAVLDNGVKKIEPLADILINGYDITKETQPDPFDVKHEHGTVVSSLAAAGLSFFNNSIKNIQSDAFIMPIKILEYGKGYFSIAEIERAIVSAIKKGVRIFNLSVCGRTNDYNCTISEYAAMLDRLTYQNDILIFIATGNLSIDDIQAIQSELNTTGNGNFLAYPNHFYNPYEVAEAHICECSNICIPGESYNNITVGAIADNLRDDSQSDLTLDKQLPAFYTRKHYVDYSRKINNVDISDSQKNFNINKPDIVMPGGDEMSTDSKMQVLGLGLEANDYYQFASGTSFATPLAANLAAKILNLYPALNMQTVKALIVNSASQLLNDSFLSNTIRSIKGQEAIERFHKPWDELNKHQQMKISRNISPKILYNRLIGYGMPNEHEILYSDSKSVTFIVEDSISVDSHKVVNINLPKYLLNYNKPSYILNLKATLCYKFAPIENNQLSYNPLHISFNFCDSLIKNNPSKTADIVADRNHDYLKRFYPANADAKSKSEARNKALGIKTKIGGWSEDFYPRNSKPFSNTQTLQLKINTAELEKIDRQLSLIVRCTGKKDINKEYLKWLSDTPHQFSIVINISEKENQELKIYDLYDQLSSINNLRAVNDVSIEQEIEIDADVEA